MTEGPRAQAIVARVMAAAIRGHWPALALAASLIAQSAIAPVVAHAQQMTQRGFVEVRGTVFPQQATNDPRRVIGDVIAREELFIRAADWLRLAGGFEARANSYDQVDASWRVRIEDRTAKRPALNVRRLSATLTRRGWTLDLGKQFIRWGKVDIVTPTDRFAPRDYLNVIDNDFLAVRGGRLTVTTGDDTLEAVVVPWFTPSRGPLPNQRWTVVPSGVAIAELPGPPLPTRAQAGVRWSHMGNGYEYSLALFDGFNHLPNVQAAPVAGVPATIGVMRSYPRMTMYGGDVAVPTAWLTLKAEAAYYTTSTPGSDEFVIYVVQLERQTGEWLLIGGYAGSAVTRPGGGLTFAPDRGTTRAFIGRASYTIDANRSTALEGALRQDGDGVYVKGEYSRASGAHWRTTLAGALIRGEASDFLGQFQQNSHVGLTFRYSF